jgi:hypothetical protein
MKNYLSFGGGVNSVAMYLHLMDEGWSFYPGVESKYSCEAIFVDHLKFYILMLNLLKKQRALIIYMIIANTKK